MEIDIIVPVLGRPEHALRFIHSLLSSFDNADHSVAVYPIVDIDQAKDRASWLNAADIVFAKAGIHTFPEKVNYGYACSDRDWLLLVGSDVKFLPGWIDELEKALARMPSACVLGTNDMLTSRVIIGEHTTHPVIRRSYIDEQGASWDGPGVVCHEYNHCFVDDEIVTVAKQRGVWLPVPEAKIEHLHFLNGKAELDDVYEEGFSWMETDRVEWERRLRMYGGSPS